MGSRKTQRSKGCRKALAPSHSPPPPPPPTLEALIIQIDAPQVHPCPSLPFRYCALQVSCFHYLVWIEGNLAEFFCLEYEFKNLFCEV